MKIEGNKIIFLSGNEFIGNIINESNDPQTLFDKIKNHLSPLEQDELCTYMLEKWILIKNNAFLNFLNKN